MGKLILKPNPTFKKEVEIHVPGAEPMQIVHEFCHMTRSELKTFLYGEGAQDREDIDTMMRIVKAWPGQEVEFSRAAMAELLDNYPGSAKTIMEAFIKELTKVRLGN